MMQFLDTVTPEGGPEAKAFLHHPSSSGYDLVITRAGEPARWLSMSVELVDSYRWAFGYVDNRAALTAIAEEAAKATVDVPLP